MSIYLWTSASVLSLLEDVKLHPHLDAPRLVLADWLDDHGDPDRAEFIRCQCRLAPGAAPLPAGERSRLRARNKQLLQRRGGGWVGPLWGHGSDYPLCWHRGLLSSRLPTDGRCRYLADILPWVDSVLVQVAGWHALSRAVDLLGQIQLNHLCLDLRGAFGEDTLLDHLARLPESVCLRSLSLDWPYRLLRRSEDGSGAVVRPGYSSHFVSRLAALPVGRHLTHLGSSPAWGPEHVQALSRCPRIRPVEARGWWWMHELPPSTFAFPHQEEVK